MAIVVCWSSFSSSSSSSFFSFMLALTIASKILRHLQKLGIPMGVGGGARPPPPPRRRPKRNSAWNLNLWLTLQPPPLHLILQVTPNILAAHGSPIGIAWLIPLGILNVVPMVVERKLEFTYLSFTDIVFSIPFYSHQNRITADYFALALMTKKGAYMASGRGLGNTRTSIVDIFLCHSISNFLPGPPKSPKPRKSVWGCVSPERGGGGQGSIRMAVHRRRRGIAPLWTPPPQTIVTIVGKK